jgi:hypothetical protein
MTSETVASIAHVSVRRIVADLRERQGLLQTWESIDDEVQGDIRAEWEKIIRKQIVRTLSCAPVQPTPPRSSAAIALTA